MSNASQLLNAGSGAVPPGDSLRFARTAVPATTETTILNVTGAKFLTKGILLDFTFATGSTTITSLKVTIDGAAERTLVSSAFPLWQVTASTWGQSYFFPLEINALTSCVIKITTSNQTDAIVQYYED